MHILRFTLYDRSSLMFLSLKITWLTLLQSIVCTLDHRLKCLLLKVHYMKSAFPKWKLNSNLLSTNMEKKKHTHKKQQQQKHKNKTILNLSWQSFSKIRFSDIIYMCILLFRYSRGSNKLVANTKLSKEAVAFFFLNNIYL